jgi:Arylsulfotransferase (ASST)
MRNSFEKQAQMSRKSRGAKLLASASVAFFCSMSGASAIPSVYPTGVTIYDPARAYNCYVLFGDSSASKTGETHLIDMDGTEVHAWHIGGFPSAMVDPALVDGKRGIIGVQVSHLESKGIGVIPGLPDVYQDKEIGLVDWDSNVLWKGGSGGEGGGLHQHHDWGMLPNGHVLALGSWHHAIADFGNREMFDDVIYEMDRAGNIVWKWTTSDHLNELGFSPEQLTLIHHAPILDYFHVNDMEVVGPNHWFDAGDKRFAPDNIIISSRNANFTAIIDHKTGEVVWRIGPNYPGRNLLLKADTIPAPVNQISGQHDPRMISEGLPGAGNILVFDNQGEAGYPPVALDPLGGTRVLEIDPVKKEIVWEYSARSSQQPEWEFYSPIVGSAQRLPNGNTLIDEGTDGRIFQVTRDGDIVWEYVSPYQMPVPVTPLPGRPGIKGNLVYRAQAVPYSWVPEGTVHGEQAVTPPALNAFQVSPSAPK